MTLQSLVTDILRLTPAYMLLGLKCKQRESLSHTLPWQMERNLVFYIYF